jgi:hypothetical protein
MKWAEIILKSVDYANETFAPGERANPNWICKVLYHYQFLTSDPNSELEQDILWAAEKIEPDRYKWKISLEEYEIAMNSKDLDPHGRRKKIRDFLSRKGNSSH